MGGAYMGLGGWGRREWVWGGHWTGARSPPSHCPPQVLPPRDKEETGGPAQCPAGALWALPPHPL